MSGHGSDHPPSPPDAAGPPRSFGTTSYRSPSGGQNFRNVLIGLTPKQRVNSFRTWHGPRFRTRLPSSRPDSRRRRPAPSTWQSVVGRTGSAVRDAEIRMPTCCRGGGFGSARVASDRPPRRRGRCCTRPACRSRGGSRPPTSSPRSLQVFPRCSSGGNLVLLRTRPRGPCSIGFGEPCFGPNATSSPARWRWTKEAAARRARFWSFEPSRSEENVARPSFPRSLAEFQALFSEEAACARYLAESRWPDGDPEIRGQSSRNPDFGTFTRTPFQAPSRVTSLDHRQWVGCSGSTTIQVATTSRATRMSRSRSDWSRPAGVLDHADRGKPWRGFGPAREVLYV